MKILAVDFDGTLAFSNKYGQLETANIPLFKTLIEYQNNGHKIILWTCREGKDLEEAKDFCVQNRLLFDAVNENVPEWQNKTVAKRKIYYDILIDDRAVNPNEFLKED